VVGAPGGTFLHFGVTAYCRRVEIERLFDDGTYTVPVG
jgi:hypothetical protein